jgi:hypothetical protein
MIDDADIPTPRRDLNERLCVAIESKNGMTAVMIRVKGVLWMPIRSISLVVRGIGEESKSK